LHWVQIVKAGKLGMER